MLVRRRLFDSLVLRLDLPVSGVCVYRQKQLRFSQQCYAHIDEPDAVTVLYSHSVEKSIVHTESETSFHH